MQFANADDRLRRRSPRPHTMVAPQPAAIASAISDPELCGSQEPSTSPALVSGGTVTRGGDGRFVSPGNGSLLSVSRHWEKNRRYRVKLRNQQDRYFRGYVRVFFISGERRDFVPFSSRSGPFVRVFERLFHAKFILGRNDRSIMLQTIYRNDGFLGRPIEVARISLKDVGDPNSSGSRVKVYRFRKLSSLTREATEMKPLIDWLQEMGNEGALRIPWEDALKICAEAMRSHYCVLGPEVGYIEFPSESPSRGSSTAGERLPRIMNDTTSPPECEGTSPTTPTPVDEISNCNAI